MMLPKLLLLGQPLLLNGASSTHLRSTKPNLLAWYLAAHPGQLLPRAQLTALFWGDTPDAPARAALSTTLNRLRQTLPVWPVATEGDLVGWRGHPGLEVDLSHFLQLSGLPSPTLAQLTDAVALWRGPFLATAHLPESPLFEEWLQSQRVYLEEQVLHLYGQLLALSQAAGAWAALLDHARQALAINPYQEAFHRYLMQALHQTGDRRGALSHYRTLETFLQTELQIRPHPSTRSLRDAILDDLPPAALVSNQCEQQPLVITIGQPDDSFIGRGPELAQLEEALAPAGPRLVVVGGEAGIGKTTFAAQVMKRRQGQGTVLLGRCYQGFGDLPFAPIIEALTPLLRSTEPSWGRLPTYWLAEVARLVPELAVLRPDLAAEAVPFVYRTHLLEALAHFLSSLPTPCLLVLEDLHWADDSTLQLLAYLARWRPQLPIQILVTLRPNELPERIKQLQAQLRREGLLLELGLGPLSQAELGELVASRIGRPHRQLTVRLYQETQGHPLYVSELLAALAETNQLRGSPPAVLPLPPTVEGIIAQRLGRLGPQVGQLLTALAIYPKGAPLACLEPHLDSPLVTYLPGIEAALTAGLIQEGPEALLTFTHELIRRVALQGASQARRQLLHRHAFTQLLEQVEQTPGEGYSLAQAKELAHHATSGRLYEQGYRWSQRAAALAAALFSYAEATQLYGQALACSNQIGADRDRLERETDLRVKMARLGQFYHRPGRMVQWLAPARRAAKALNDPARLTKVTLARAEAWLTAGRTSTGLKFIEALLATPDTLVNPEQRAQALFLMGCNYGMLGENQRALIALTEALSCLEPTLTNPFHLLIRSTLGAAAAQVGQFELAETELVATLAEARRFRLRPIVANVYYALASASCQLGRWQEAQQRAEAGMSGPTEADHQWHQYFCSQQLPVALIRQGRVTDALSAIDYSLRLAQTIGTRVLQDRLYANQAEAHIAFGDGPAALAATEQGIKLAQQLGATYGLALNQQQRGRALALQGDRLMAQELLFSALRLLTEQGSWPAVARCQADLAGVLADLPEATYHRQQALALKERLGIIEL